MATITAHTTRATGTVLTAAIYNGDHQNHVTNANALNTDLTVFSGLSVADGNIIVANGTTWEVQSGADALATLGAVNLNDIIKTLKNELINGNFDIWQRGTSTTSDTYLADQWIAGSHAVTSKTASRQAFTLGQTDVPGEPKYFNRTVVVTASDSTEYAILEQRIEGVRTLAGQTATITFWAKADAAKDIAVEFVQSFGTGGSPSSDVTGIEVATISLTTAWQKFSFTVDIPSISGKTLGTNDYYSYLSVIFWFTAGSTLDARTNSLGTQSGTFDIARVSLLPGDLTGADDPFPVRTYADEMRLCERYYQVLNRDFSGHIGSANTILQMVWSHRVEMLYAPTATAMLVSSFGAIVNGSARTVTGASLNTSNMDKWGGRARIDCNALTSDGSGDPIVGYNTDGILYNAAVL